MKKCDIDIISFSFFLFFGSFIYSLVHSKNKNKFYFYQFSYWFQHILLLIFMIHRMINRTQNRFFSKCFLRKLQMQTQIKIREITLKLYLRLKCIYVKCISWNAHLSNETNKGKSITWKLYFAKKLDVDDGKMNTDNNYGSCAK